jgi:hypothetical protein
MRTRLFFISLLVALALTLLTAVAASAQSTMAVVN